MAITVKTNMAATGALNALNKTSRALAGSFQRISSGLRISKAADDAAGLGVAENLKASYKSADVAGRNINDGISIIGVAEGAAGEVGDILVRMRELAVQSASETLEDDERTYVQDEFTALSSEVDRIANVTNFNGKKLSDGSVPTVAVQVGTGDTADDQISITLGDLTAATLGVDTGAIGMDTAANATTSLAAIDSAIAMVTGYRSDLGAVENRLGSALNTIEIFSETTKSAESAIRDADFGYETAQLSQNQILQQAGVSILAQAKTLNQSAQQLLQ
jgi:flagellin